MDKARSMIEEARKKNKTAQEVQRINRRLTMMEANLGLPAHLWRPQEVFGFILLLETDTKSGQKIVIKSLERKFAHVKSIFRDRGHPLSEAEERGLRMALNEHENKRIDKAEKPTRDRSAPILSPIQWVKIQKWLLNEGKDNTPNFKNKKFMAMLSISLGFSTGLRLSEIHRIKYSDLDLDGEDEIKLRIRRSKSNRKGNKIVWQVAPAFAAEPLLCPVRNLMLHVEENKKIMYPGAYIFADDEEGKKLTRINNLVNYWRKGAKGAGLDRKYWPEAHSHHNSKINIARALGFTEEQITDAMNWTSVSVLHQYLRRANENRGGIAYKITSLSAEKLTELTAHLWN